MPNTRRPRLHLNAKLSLLALGTVALTVVTAGTASGFGTTEILGQNSEHQHLTESIVKADPSWEANSLALLAGNKGNYGGVGAADRATDSSATPLVGLGPGYKHCDDGDWLDIPGYKQGKSSAKAELARCARYYQTLMNWAVRYAGSLVSPAMKVNEGVFTMTSKSPIKPDNVCQYRFSLTPDKNAKCDVMNAFGRALHVAEDVWSHSNWGDVADSTRDISITNPPGLNRTDIPGFLRYPVSNIEIPDGLISGCDDSVPVVGPGNCKGRVTHSALAKDNGTIDTDGDGAADASTDKYARGMVTVNGQTNFQRATKGARAQVASSWNDLKDAIVAKYGDERGNAIISVITSDSPKTLEAEVTLAEGPLVMSTQQGPTGEFAADPADDAPLGAGDKVTDTGHAALHSDSEEGGERQAAGLDSDVDAAPAADESTVSASEATSGVTESGVWLLAVVALAVVAIGGVIYARSRRTGH